MCGIVGYYSHGSSNPPGVLDKALGKLAHRGPDDSGLFNDGPFSIGHTRLSIIDLSGGHQPLVSSGGNLALIANGEIYNYLELREELIEKGHRFLTMTDSEVILHAYEEYGDHFLKHLHGMFAFALFDKGKKLLILARDRLGIKPLFFANLPDGIAFSSELKALIPLMDRQAEIDPRGLAEFLQNQFNSGLVTILKDVERLLPGEFIKIVNGRLTERKKYWSALDVKSEKMDGGEARDRFDVIMELVMKQHMRSDVPFGLFLSGGVDSSVLLALLSQWTDEPVRTFSVGFPGTRLINELPAAKKMAQRFSSRHTEITPGAEDLKNSLAFTIWAADDLMRDYANLPTCLLAEAAGKELKVVFSGEGGDEVFAGYGRYRMPRIERFLKSMIVPGTGGFRTRGTFRGQWPGSLFREPLLEAARDHRRPFKEAWTETPAHWSELQRMQYTDLVTALPDNLLVKADRMLMAWGVEGRVPFLDHRVVEFGLSLPDELKVEGNQGKAFLKRWAASYIPPEHLKAPKKGFHVPVGDWFDDDFLKDLMSALPDHIIIKEWFKPEGVRRLIGACRRNSHAKRMVMAMVQFAIWSNLFILGDGERPPARIHPLELISTSK